MEPPISVSGLHLWLLPRETAERQRLCAKFLSVLPPPEQEAYRAIPRPERAQRFLLGRILVRCALSHYLKCPPDALALTVMPSGKLRVNQASAAGLDFSLSHTLAETVLAIAPAKGLGIDIELFERARTVRRIGARFFAASERACVDHEGDEAADLALSYWTLKEAVVKAVGSSIWRGLGAFSFDVRGETPAWSSPPPVGGRQDWLLALGRFGPCHRLAVAVYLPEKVDRTLEWVTHVLGGSTLPQRDLELSFSADLQGKAGSAFLPNSK